MQVLFVGIWNKFNIANGAATALKNAVTGMYLTEAPQGTAYPYIVYHKISGVPDWTFSEDMENVLIQFNIYDDNSSSATINDIYTKLIALYDWCTLSVTNWNSIYMKRELDELTRDNDIWRYLCQYRLEIQK